MSSNNSVKLIASSCIKEIIRKIIVFILPAFILSFSVALLPSATYSQSIEGNLAEITSVSPDQAHNYTSTTIIITGSGFIDSPTVKLNDFILKDISFIDGNTITAVVPSDLPGGDYMLEVTNPDDQSVVLENAFSVLMSGDGNLVHWELTKPMNEVVVLTQAVEAGNYIYVIGGSAHGGYSNNVKSAPINPDGSIEPWKNNSPMVMSRRAHAVAVSRNCIYATGSGNSVEYAKILKDGVLGEWQLTESMTHGRYDHETVATDDYIYVLGGIIDGGYQATNYVERARINPDCSLEPWAPTAQLNTGRTSFISVRVGNYIYALGGYYVSPFAVRVILQNVEKASINEDGSLGAWENVSSMAESRCNLASVAAQGYIYAFGGSAGAGYSYDSVERARVNKDGTLGPWETISSLHAPRQMFAAVTNGRFIYAIGGEVFGTGTSSVERTEISVPTISAFTPIAVTSDHATTVTVPGTNLLPEPILQFEDEVLDVVYVSLSELSVVIPDSLPIGWHDVVLTNGDGREVELPNAFRVDGPGPVVLNGHGVTINGGALFTNDINVMLTISSTHDTAQIQVSNDGGFIDAQWETYSSHKPWEITQYGAYVIPRTVYIRYKDLDGTISPTFQDDIILDVIPPEGSVKIIELDNDSISTDILKINSGEIDGFSNNFSNKLFLPLVMTNIQTPNVTLLLGATDDVSGVGFLMISNIETFDHATWRAYVDSVDWFMPVDSNSVYVKYMDNAGNISQIYSANR